MVQFLFHVEIKKLFKFYIETTKKDLLTNVITSSYIKKTKSVTIKKKNKNLSLETLLEIPSDLTRNYSWCLYGNFSL